MYQRKNIKYLLGIDGGGTKTEFLLTNINKKEIKRIVLGASNPVNIGIDGTKKLLEKGISDICSDVDFGEVAVFAGIAGGGTPKNKELINAYLSGFGFGYCANGSDIDSALELALRGKDGIVVITGTGIVGFAQKNGSHHRIGGWGYMIDKGGSGFCYGSDALNCALRYADGRGGSGLILELIEKRLQKPLSESIADIYAGGAAYVASFAPVVFEAFNSGDGEARKIININTKELADIIRAGYNFSGTQNCKAVICGGLCKQQKITAEFLEKHLDSKYPFYFTDEPIINGAILLAERGAKNA